MPRVVIDVGAGDSARAEANRAKEAMRESGLNAHIEGGGDETQIVVEYPYNEAGRQEAVALKLQLAESGMPVRIETANYPGQYEEEEYDGEYDGEYLV